jgi:hypothetical protein
MGTFLNSFDKREQKREQKARTKGVALKDRLR